MSALLDEGLRKGVELIRSKLLEMGTLAERATAASVTALLNRDRRLANAIVLKDDRIDELEKQLDRLCLEFLVRQQPVAGHLRFLYSCIRINTELERIGDYAEGIARQVLDLSAEPGHPAAQLLAPIGDLATRMLHETMRAFAAQDVDLARATMAIERDVDRLRTDIRTKLLAEHKDHRLPTEVLVPLLVVTARLERVADQAANICEEVLYMCTGEVEKHKGAEGFRVLFLYKSWSHLGMMAEGIATSLNLPHFVFSSAGLDATEPDLRTVEFMASKGIDASRWVPRTIRQIPNLEYYQVAILLSEGTHALSRELPAKCIRLQWRPPSPPPRNAPAEVAAASSERLFQFLSENIKDFVDAISSDDIYP